MAEKELNLDNLSEEELKNLVRDYDRIAEHLGRLVKDYQERDASLAGLVVTQQANFKPVLEEYRQIKANMRSKKLDRDNMIKILIALVIIGLFYFLFNRNKFM